MRRTSFASLIGLGILLLATPSFAQSASEASVAPDPAVKEVPQGIEIGLRSGLPFGGGSMMKGVSMDAKAAVPLWVDLGYRFHNLYVGAYGQYAYIVPATGPTACPEGASCSAHALSFGVNAHYHFRPGRTTDPWLGVGAGYETAAMSGSIAGHEFAGTFEGFQFFNLQGGADFKLARTLALGPFATAGIGEFSSSSARQDDHEVSGAIPSEQRALHVTALLGVRGSFNVFEIH